MAVWTWEVAVVEVESLPAPIALLRVPHIILKSVRGGQGVRLEVRVDNQEDINLLKEQLLAVILQFNIQVAH